MKKIIGIIMCLYPFLLLGQGRQADSMQYNGLMTSVTEKYKKIQTLFKEVEMERIQVSRAFYKSHRDSEFGLKIFAGLVQHDKDLRGLEADFNLFSPRIKASVLGRDLHRKITALINTEVGVRAMDFTQNDINGKPVQLSDFKGKYVLVDFWASWCKPCRAENPHVVKTFNAFKDKGFNVLSVSLDSKREAWIEAIEKDGMPWYHVSDLKGWNNAVAKLYGISSIPQNLLIGPDGKIVAKNLRGEELMKKVGELIGIDKKL